MVQREGGKEVGTKGLALQPPLPVRRRIKLRECRGTEGKEEKYWKTEGTSLLPYLSGKGGAIV